VRQARRTRPAQAGPQALDLPRLRKNDTLEGLRQPPPLHHLPPAPRTGPPEEIHNLTPNQNAMNALSTGITIPFWGGPLHGTTMDFPDGPLQIFHHVDTSPAP
jgi:hypothetical protein